MSSECDLEDPPGWDFNLAVGQQFLGRRDPGCRVEGENINLSPTFNFYRKKRTTGK